MKNIYIIGTRGSDLALWQSRFILNQLTELGVNAELNIIQTQGDQIQHLSFDKMEGKGFFTKEIENALLLNEIDLAVHSFKDLESEYPEGLTVAAMSERADSNDLLLMNKAAFDPDEKWQLKKQSRLGTSSIRRKKQLIYNRPDLNLTDLRGNVPTRIEKLRSGQYDAIVIAKAGVDRLQLDISDLLSYVFATHELVPAPAQGVLAVQCRSSDSELKAILQKIHSHETEEVVSIERNVLKSLGGGCQLPFGIHVLKNGEQFEAEVAYAPRGEAPLRFYTFLSDQPTLLTENIINELRNEL